MGTLSLKPESKELAMLWTALVIYVISLFAARNIAKKLGDTGPEALFICIVPVVNTFAALLLLCDVYNIINWLANWFFNKKD